MSNSEIFVSLDIGTSTVKVMIGEMSDNSLNVIGIGTAKSDGLRKGTIVDIDKTVNSIRKAIDQAERMIGMQINKVIVGIAGNQVGLLPCHGVVAVSSENREITDEDVNRVIEAAEVMSIPPDREIINILPTQFIVDGLDEISDPRGMIGVRLEMEGVIIIGSKTNLHNTLRCVERAGLEVVDIALQPLAAASAALSEDEKSLGTALIDIGGGSTSVIVFENGTIKGTSVIPVGGDNITKDLSIGLRTTMEDAEKIKRKYGHAYYDDASVDEIFSVPIIGSDQHQQFNQLELAEIIEARVQEIFELVQNELNMMNATDLPGGIVLTGGVANLLGVMELAQEVFHNRVRVAIPDYIGVREPQYTTAVGLIKYAYKQARLEGREISLEPVYFEPAGKKQSVKGTQNKQPEKPSEEKITTKMKKFFVNFFE